MDKPKLHLDWATHEAAKYAVEHWHYSRRMPKCKLVKIGVWEDDKFIGVVIFSLGANRNIAKPFGLADVEVCELTRVALTNHASAVTQIIALGLRILKTYSPGLRLVVSYADADQGHLGKIYQGGNWIFIGMSACTMRSYCIHGKESHSRAVFLRYGTNSLPWIQKHVDPSATKIFGLGKYKYVYALDRQMREQIALLAQPYPKRVGSIDSDVTDIQSDQGGASPTSTLQNKRKKRSA